MIFTPLTDIFCQMIMKKTHRKTASMDKLKN